MPREDESRHYQLSLEERFFRSSYLGEIVEESEALVLEKIRFHGGSGC